jgi:Polyketide cyclase / dehydrase and lipid transport
MGTNQRLEDGRIDMPDLVVSGSASVPPAQLYGTLADLSTHTAWAGSMHGKKNFGLRTLEASAEPAVVGTEFRSTGADPMGSFTDRSVVTEATSPSVFEFVTEGHLAPKKHGKPASDTRITYRFEIAPSGTGSTVTYRAQFSKWTNAPAILRSAALRPIARMASKSYAKRMLRNLAEYAATNRGGER